jgi:hypothetical protein
MPFEKVVEDKHLRYRWTGSTAIDASWRFVEFSNRRGTLYVRVDASPWTYYKADGGGASTGEIGNVRGRGSSADKIIQGKIDATVSVKKAPSHGNPYGRFPEDTTVAILGEYQAMEDVDFTKLSDGLGLRVLDEGFLGIFGGCPETLEDEWGRKWQRLADRTDYRPWGIYVPEGQPLALQVAVDKDVLLAARHTCKLPEIKPYTSHTTLTPDNLKVIQTLDRKTFSSQKTVMKNNSAADVAELIGYPRSTGWEWLHLVAFSMKGGEAQAPDNLVLGTEAANTAMMLVEQFVKDQVDRGRCESATIAVGRDCPLNTCGWYTTNIHYTVKLVKFGRPHYLRESFNPFTLMSPAYVLKQITGQLDRFKSGPAPRPVSDTIVKSSRPFGRRL